MQKTKNSKNEGKVLFSSNSMDRTGNKKFKCRYCIYRTNRKSDLIVHQRLQHDIAQPTMANFVILSPEEAARTFDQYEQLHGQVINKRGKYKSKNKKYNLTSWIIEN